MSKRLTASIKSNIERLDKKIAASKAELLLMFQQRDKFLEMLHLIEPQPELPPKPADAPSSDTPQATLPEGENSPASLETGKRSAFHEKLHKHGDAV